MLSLLLKPSSGVITDFCVKSYPTLLPAQLGIPGPTCAIPGLFTLDLPLLYKPCLRAKMNSSLFPNTSCLFLPCKYSICGQRKLIFTETCSQTGFCIPFMSSSLYFIAVLGCRRWGNRGWLAWRHTVQCGRDKIQVSVCLSPHPVLSLSDHAL